MTMKAKLICSTGNVLWATHYQPNPDLNLALQSAGPVT